MSAALHDPSIDDCETLCRGLCSEGLWKIGSCFEDLIHVRPHTAAHYNPRYFDRSGAICLARGIGSKQRSATLETHLIHLTKYELRTGINTKDQDDVPHDTLSPQRPGALYAVPTQAHLTTQQQYTSVHVSYYMEHTHGGTTRQERKTAKRAQLLEAYMDKIPMGQLQAAFSGRNRLSELVVAYGFKTVRTTTYFELKELFADLD